MLNSKNVIAWFWLTVFGKFDTAVLKIQNYIM